jgi:putative transcriptional regulator
MKSAFDKIAAGLEDAIAYTEGDTSRARVAEPLDVKAIRKRTNKSQEAFAATYRLPVGTVRDWEQNRRQPDAPARVLLSLIQAEPEAVEKLIARAGA